MSGSVVSSPRTTSSSSSSIASQTPRRTMEEVWKDINLSSLNQDMPPTLPLSLHYHHPANPTTAYARAGVTLQDFLSGPFRDADLAAVPHTCPRGPAASLTLGSGAPFLGFLSPSNSDSSFSGCCPAPLVMLKKGTAAFGDNGDGENVVDRRKKRMIKNCESAARSRARKQAYTNELEKEVEHLLEENRKLKLEYEELLKQTMPAQLPVAKKWKLPRTSSAPL